MKLNFELQTSSKLLHQLSGVGKRQPARVHHSYLTKATKFVHSPAFNRRPERVHGINEESDESLSTSTWRAAGLRVRPLRHLICECDAQSHLMPSHLVAKANVLDSFTSLYVLKAAANIGPSLACPCNMQHDQDDLD